MKRILKNKEALLPIITLFLLGIFVGYYIWAIQEIAYTMGWAININKQTPDPATFDLEEASKINFRGLVTP